MRRNDQRRRLGEIPLFEGLAKRDLEHIHRAAAEVEFREGTEIVTEGMTGRDFYLILAGEATMTRKRRRIGTLGPGDYFGEIAVLTNHRRTATVTAKTRVSALRLESTDFLSLLDATPRIARKILQRVATRLMDADPSPTH